MRAKMIKDFLNEELNIKNLGLFNDKLVIAINGRMYSYDPIDIDPKTLEHKFSQMMHYSNGKALTWLKKHSKLTENMNEEYYTKSTKSDNDWANQQINQHLMHKYDDQNEESYIRGVTDLIYKKFLAKYPDADDVNLISPDIIEDLLRDNGNVSDYFEEGVPIVTAANQLFHICEKYLV